MRPGTLRTVSPGYGADANPWLVPSELTSAWAVGPPPSTMSGTTARLALLTRTRIPSAAASAPKLASGTALPKAARHGAAVVSTRKALQATRRPMPRISDPHAGRPAGVAEAGVCGVDETLALVVDPHTRPLLVHRVAERQASSRIGE